MARVQERVWVSGEAIAALKGVNIASETTVPTAKALVWPDISLDSPCSIEGAFWKIDFKEKSFPILLFGVTGHDGFPKDPAHPGPFCHGYGQWGEQVGNMPQWTDDQPSFMAMLSERLHLIR